MSRYLDRLTNDAAVQFRETCRQAGIDVSTDDKAEDALIALARESDGLSDAGRVGLMYHYFGSADAFETAAVLDAILADLDSDAEVAGEPIDDTPPARIRVIVAEIEGASPAESERFARMVGEIMGRRS